MCCTKAVNTFLGNVLVKGQHLIIGLFNFRYSVDRHTDMDRIFNIDSGNGSIFTSKPLDRESSLWHNITVIATEMSKSILNTNIFPVVMKQVLAELILRNILDSMTGLVEH